MKKRRIIVVILLIFLLVGLTICFIYLRNDWFAFLNSDKHIIGRDTVAYWCSSDGGIEYEILQSGATYQFSAFDSPYKNSKTYREIKNIHYYADTTDYIFIITNDHLSYCVDKKTRDISIMTSSFFDLLSSEEEKVCFENLLFSKDHIIKRYCILN